MEERLVEYFDTLPASLSQFADAPLRAVGVACTGSSYLAGRDREDTIFQDLSHRLGIHVTSSALAVVDALHALDARRIGLVSPYPESLLQQASPIGPRAASLCEAVAKVVASLPIIGVPPARTRSTRSAPNRSCRRCRRCAGNRWTRS